MKKTAFGKLMMKIRIDQELRLYDMAQLLSVSSSYLSAVENGKRNIPEELTQKIKNIFKADAVLSSDIDRARIQTNQVAKIDMNNADNLDTDLVMAFARSFRDLDEGKKRKLIDDWSN